VNMRLSTLNLNKYKINLTFLIILFLVPLAQISIDIYSPSLPGIVKYYHTTESDVQDTVSIFLISLGLGQLFYGSLSDSLGRRKILLIGLFVFSFY
jgi:DHA1 family bicyclomycin/chloramphenicol resistance-like MFS transporter